MEAGSEGRKLKVLLDKLHGEDLDTYDKFVKFLSERCQVTIMKKKPLDLKLLTENDVLMLISPNKPWDQFELRNIQQYVEGYRGVLMIMTDGRKRERLGKLLESYGLSLTPGTVSEKYLDRDNLEGSQLLQGVYSLALGAVWGYESPKIAVSKEAEVVLQYKEAILGVKRLLGGTVYLLSCLPAFGNKQLEQVDNRRFINNLLKSLTTSAMTATLEIIAEDEASMVQAAAVDTTVATQKIIGCIVTGRAEDLFFTEDTVIVAKKGSIAKFFGWGFLGSIADEIYKGVQAARLSELSPDKILRSDKRNFAIRYEEIRRFDIRKTFPFGVREITIETSADKHVFYWELGIARDTRKHVDFLSRLLPDKLVVEE